MRGKAKVFVFSYWTIFCVLLESRDVLSRDDCSSFASSSSSSSSSSSTDNPNGNRISEVSEIMRGDIQNGGDANQDGGWHSLSAKFWGKRGIEGTTKWGQIRMKRSVRLCDSDKRKWGRNNQRVWGKRDGGFLTSPSQSTWRTWLEKKLLSYKAAIAQTDDRGSQPEVTSDNWESEEGDETSQKTKRKWGQNKAKVWGKRDVTEEEKRKWGQNKAMVWGKRNEQEQEQDLNEAFGLEKQERDAERQGQSFSPDLKRKWGENKAKVWGKRDDKRKWGSNKAKVWGKRTGIEDEKRKWGSNKAKVWGKRGVTDDAFLQESENLISWQNSEGRNKEDDIKRKWGNNKAKVWGKRELPTSATYTKRKWGRTSAKVWGLRAIRREANEKRTDDLSLGRGKNTDLTDDMRTVLIGTPAKNACFFKTVRVLCPKVIGITEKADDHSLKNFNTRQVDYGDENDRSDVRMSSLASLTSSMTSSDSDRFNRIRNMR